MGNKVMTVILPRGEATALVKELFEQYGLNAIISYSGRGQQGTMGKKQWHEVDVVNLVVTNEQADEVFTLLYDLVELAQKPNRLLFQAAVEKSSQMILPESLA